jgi:nitroreductase
LDYKKLVEAAILAPTPDNNQPWRFAVQDARLLVYVDRSRALPSDVNGMFDLMGLGAAVENACIAAREHGFEPKVELADCRAEDLGHPSHPAAAISFSPGGQPDPLYPYIATRCTCRTLYSKKPLPAEDLARMSKAAKQAGEVHVDWVTDRPRINELARLLAASDLIRFEYEPFHNELFRQLRFTAREAEQTRDGLDVRTLELPIGAAWLLHKLRFWSRMRKIHQLGLGRLLTVPSAVAVRRSGAIGLLSVDQPEAGVFLQGGMAFQRLWLAATSLDLAVQPLGSLPIFLAHWLQLGGSRLAAAHQARVQILAGRLQRLVPYIGGRVVQLMFRIGRSKPPKFRSIRRHTEDVFQG